MRRIIAYSVGHPIVANLTMGLLLILGVISLAGMVREAFPEVALDMIQISVPFPGASPREVEDGVVIKIEEAIQGVAGIDQVDSVSAENMGQVIVTIAKGADPDEVLREVQAKVDQIVGLPDDAETPVVTMMTRVRGVIDIMLFGDADRVALKEVADRLRDKLLLRPEISLVDVQGLRAREISVELSEADMRRYHLTFDEVFAAIRGANLDLTSGMVRTSREDIRIRTFGKRYEPEEMEDIVLRADASGQMIRLRDIGGVRERWEDTPNYLFYNGKPAVGLEVRKTETEDTLVIIGALRSFLDEVRPTLPPGVGLELYADSSKVLRDRIDLMVKNGAIGLILVLVSLSLFLNLRLSLWVAVGIPISFAGTFLVASAFGSITINVISLFGLILVSGILVDDAIVVSENIYSKVEQGMAPRRAAVEGTAEVFPAVFASVITTMISFAPLFFVGGRMGKFVWQIAAMVILALAVSLVESMFVLPAHLAHTLEAKGDREHRRIPTVTRGFASIGAFFRHSGMAIRDRLDAGFQLWVRRIYRPSVAFAVRFRWVTLAVAWAFVAVTSAFVAGGQLKFVFFPNIDSDDIAARVILSAGTPEEETIAFAKRVEAQLQTVAEELKAEDPEGRDIVLRVKTTIGAQAGGNAMTGAEVLEVAAELLPAEDRTYLSSRTVVERWKKLVGPIPGAQSVYFGNGRVRSFGKPVQVSFLGNVRADVREAAERLKTALREYPGLFGIEDDSPKGKREVHIELRPLGRSLGVTLRDVATQLRHGFYGFEVLRLQRGRDELKVYVRYPDEGQVGLSSLDEARIRTPDGRELALSDVASYSLTDGTVWLKRLHRQGVISVMADVDESRANAAEIVEDLKNRVLPGILADLPSVSASQEGEQQEQRKTMESAMSIVPIALLLIIVILILVFQSFVQAVLILLMIPIGYGGMVVSHLVWGIPMAILSVFGMIALSGVVINDSVVFIDKINANLREGMSVQDAAINGGVARFRAIILTSLTTVAGLGPIIFETSLQAQFLIPMALTLAGGLAVGTFFTLVALPSGFAALNDLRRVARWLRRGEWPTDREVEPAVRALELQRELEMGDEAPVPSI